MDVGVSLEYGCYQFVKVKNFESNSQPVWSRHLMRMCCYQFVKVKNFESNSQHFLQSLPRYACCYQFVKVKNFESNSQLVRLLTTFKEAVISLSKLKISKAIHNPDAGEHF